MKKLVLASVMALASISLVTAPTLRAQGSDQITHPEPRRIQCVSNRQHPDRSKGQSLGPGRLSDRLSAERGQEGRPRQTDCTYQQTGDADKALGAASRLLQVDPNNMKAIYLSVIIKRSQCLKTSDPQTCDDAAALAPKGPGGSQARRCLRCRLEEDDRRDLSHLPLGHRPRRPGLKEGLQGSRGRVQEGADALSAAGHHQRHRPRWIPCSSPRPMPSPMRRDMVQAIWFYARAWNFAPPAYKAQIEPKLEYWYKRYHGNLDGLDAVKTASAAHALQAGFVHHRARAHAA